MHALCKENAAVDAAKPVRKLFASARRAVKVTDPQCFVGEAEFGPSRGQLEFEVFQNAPDRPKWFVFSDLSRRGLRKDRFLKLVEEGDLEVKALTTSGWSNVDEQELQDL